MCEEGAVGGAVVAKSLTVVLCGTNEPVVLFLDRKVVCRTPVALSCLGARLKSGAGQSLNGNVPAAPAVLALHIAPQNRVRCPSEYLAVLFRRGRTGINERKCRLERLALVVGELVSLPASDGFRQLQRESR